jgi:hypothetical protein
LFAIFGLSHHSIVTSKNSSKKERLFFNQVEKSSTDKKLRCNELAMNSLMLQLSDVKDQKLRTSLKNLSNNFVNSRK